MNKTGAKVHGAIEIPAKRKQPRNKAMARKLASGEALDVRVLGEEIEPGLFHLSHFVAGVDYCDSVREEWIWSIGQDDDRVICAATDDRFYKHADYRCLWLR